MDIQFYIKGKTQPYQTNVNGYNHLFGIPKFDFLSYLNFVFSIKYNHVNQLALEEFTAIKVLIKGAFVVPQSYTFLDYNDIDIKNGTKSVSYSLDANTLSETLECGIYQFYIWNEAGEEYYSQPIYIQGSATGDFNDDFNADFYL